jgi:FAD:protein FMN transferase
MGVPVRIRLYAADESLAQTAARAAYARIAALDQMMSDYRPDSELRSVEQGGAHWTVVSAELFAVVSLAVEIARASAGAFDPTIGPLVALWRQARNDRRRPERAALEAARARVGWQHIDLDRARRAVRLRQPDMRLDLGGIAKGYILQEAVRTLRAHSISCALVEGGGDIVVGDAPPGRDGWQIEADGADAAFRARAGRLTNRALSTSGHTAQFVEIDGVRYSHVIDPRTGLGLTNLIVARVIAEDAATADALSTALTVVGPDRAATLLAKFPEVVASVVRIPVTALHDKNDDRIPFYVSRSAHRANGTRIHIVSADQASVLASGGGGPNAAAKYATVTSAIRSQNDIRRAPGNPPPI